MKTFQFETRDFISIFLQNQGKYKYILYFPCTESRKIHIVFSLITANYPCHPSSGLVTPTESGSVEIRGFKGDYTIQVRRGVEELAEVAVSLTEDMEVTCTYQAGNMLCA